MKRFFKILGKVILVIVLLFVALLIYAMNMDHTPKEDYGKEIASFDIFYGVCNEDYQGTNRIYLKDTIYTLEGYNNPAKDIGKTFADILMENWSAVDVEEERRKSIECVEKGKALRRERSKKKRSEEKREKEIKEAIEALLDK